MQRREFIKGSAVILATGVLKPLSVAHAEGKAASPLFELPNLPFAFGDLEPHIDTTTMQIHHGKHHQGYVSNLNHEIELDPRLAGVTLKEINQRISKYNMAVRNNAGGHYNHSLFWQLLSPAAKAGQPSAALLAAISRDFGGLKELQIEMNQAGLARFGSGWVWLIKTTDGKLQVGSTANQDNPLMDVSELRGDPIIAVDVWEHAYYLNYQNRRTDYLDSFWKVLNWNEVNRLFV